MDRPFLLFAGSNFYPSGGWQDFQGKLATLEDVLQAVKAYDWYDIVELPELELILSGP